MLLVNTYPSESFIESAREMTQYNNSNSETQQDFVEPAVSDHTFVDGNHGKELLRGLNALRTKRKFCDVTLKVHPEHAGFPAHRQVLAAFSPYFRALYAREETNSNHQEDTILQDLSPAVLERIVEYIYTGTVRFTTENARSMFEASVLLQVENLRNACARFLKKCITSRNCLEFVVFAEKYRCRELSAKARDCVGANFAEVVVDYSPAFLSIGGKDLKEIISNDSLTVGSEDEVFEAVKKWIEHDYEQRSKYVPILMSQIRFRYMSREFLTAGHVQDSIMSSSQLSQDLVHEALKFEMLSPKEQNMVHTSRVKARWCTQAIDVISLVGGVSLEKESVGTTSDHWAFDPVNCLWYTASPLKSTRRNFGLIHWDGEMYVFGGSIDEEDVDQSVTTVEVYDPKKDQWTQVARNMKEARSRFDAVDVGETVYFVGGICNDSRRNTLEMYCHSVTEQNWEENSLCSGQLSAPIQPRYDHCTAVLDGKIYLIGGCTRGHSVLKTVECYDPSSNSWANVAPLLTARSGACAVILNNCIIVVGGSNKKKPQNNCEIYDSNKNQWEYIASMNERRDRCSAVSFKQNIYVFGGSYGRVVHNSVECYSAKTNKWKVVSHLPTSKSGFKCVSSVVNRSLVEEVCFEQV